MSQARRLAVLRDRWRWSRPLTGVAWQSAGSPLLMAGLPESGARVSVWPPLSANGPSTASSGAAAVPTWLPLTPLVKAAQPLVAWPLFWPIRLFRPLTARLVEIEQSGPAEELGALL